MADIPVNESTAETVVVVTANGQTTFAFDFLVLFPEQMTVFHGRGDVETVLTYPADFSVSGLNEPNGGTVTLNVATLANDVITMRRVTPIERLNDWQNEGDYKAALVNREQDTVFMIMQELSRDTGKTDAELRDLEGKAAVFPGGYGGSKTLPVPPPGKSIIGNAGGTGFVPSEFSERVLVDASERAVEAEGRSLAGAGRSEAARDIAEGYRDDANDSQVAAHLSEMNARSAAAATGPVIFFDSKAGAEAALPTLDDDAIIEVFQDEDHYNARTRYRVESSALDLKIYLDILALPSIAALQTLWGLYDGQVARVVDSRQFGFFKWRAGNLTAEVASDPYQGLWVAPTVASNGSLGAWQRMVEKAQYDAEWWLPDAMPANAQVRINAGILAIPGNEGKFLLPRRTVTTTQSVRFTKGLTYEGFGRGAPVDGGGGNFISIFVSANNSRLVNISSGNVQGQVIISEAAGFVVHDGAVPWQSTRRVENVSFVDCHGFNAETGLSAPPGALNHTTGGSPSFEHDVELFAPRDVYIENFQCDGIERIGIELMRTNGAEVVGGKAEMKLPDPIVGFDRGMRIAGAHNVHVSGFHVVGTTSVYGISVEASSQGGGGEYGYTYGASSNITIESCTMEDCQVGGTVIAPFARNIRFINNRIIGRSETYTAIGFIVEGASTAVNGNGFTGEQAPTLNVHILDNEAINVACFMSIGGFTYGTQVKRNTHIANASVSAAHSQTFLVGLVAGNLHRELEIVGNRSYTNSQVITAPIRISNSLVGTTIKIDDNELTPSSNGRTIDIAGDAVVRMKNDNSNKIIPTSLWALIRPPLDQEDYPKGDAPFIKGVY